jgi:hypothetical protein
MADPIKLASDPVLAGSRVVLSPGLAWATVRVWKFQQAVPRFTRMRTFAVFATAAGAGQTTVPGPPTPIIVVATPVACKWLAPRVQHRSVHLRRMQAAPLPKRCIHRREGCLQVSACQRLCQCPGWFVPRGTASFTWRWFSVRTLALARSTPGNSRVSRSNSAAP